MAQMAPHMRKLVTRLLFCALTLACGFGAGHVVARLSQGTELSLPTLTAPAASNQPSEASSPTGEPAPTTWDEALAPNYYLVLGPAQVGSAPAPGTANYGALDHLNRATGAVATITYDSMQNGLARERSETSELEPTGWGHNREVDMAMPDGSIYHGFLFNRSHLIAKSLGGDDELHNLITGTRTQNVGANVAGTEGGMAYAEGLARAWLDDHHDGTLYYAVTPIYEGDELVARSVIVDIRSSDGAVDQRVAVYNAARGFAIDYATGTFEVIEDASSAVQGIGSTPSDTAPEATPSTVVPEGTAESESGERKVIVTGSGKAYHHDTTCKGLENARSMEWVTVSEAEGMGRHPCGICGG